MLDCRYFPLLTQISKEFVNLTTLLCWSCPLLTEIPRELVKLMELDCSHCPLLTEIPKELVNLIKLSYYDCPLLTEIPIQIKKTKYENTPLLCLSSKIKASFKTVKKRYILVQRYQKETKFNESYYAPGGLGAQTLFDKYRNGIIVG